MSTLDQNKQIAAEMLRRFSAGDISGVLDLLSDDVTWWILGKPKRAPAAGTYDKQGISRLLLAMKGRLKGDLIITPISVIAEGDEVAMEARSRGELLDGKIYEQEYHFRVRVQGGKIRSVREYLDTQHVFAVWFET